MTKRVRTTENETMESDADQTPAGFQRYLPPGNTESRRRGLLMARPAPEGARGKEAPIPDRSISSKDIRSIHGLRFPEPLVPGHPLVGADAGVD